MNPVQVQFENPKGGGMYLEKFSFNYKEHPPASLKGIAVKLSRRIVWEVSPPFQANLYTHLFKRT
jgi:hypothetical protein